MRHRAVLERVYVRLYAVQGDLVRLGTFCEDRHMVCRVRCMQEALHPVSTPGGVHKHTHTTGPRVHQRVALVVTNEAKQMLNATQFRARRLYQSCSAP